MTGLEIAAGLIALFSVALFCHLILRPPKRRQP